MERKGVTYVECKRTDCPFVHLAVDGRMYAEWTHPRQPQRVVVSEGADGFTGRRDPDAISPFVQRALANALPAKATR